MHQSPKKSIKNITSTDSVQFVEDTSSPTSVWNVDKKISKSKDKKNKKKSSR